MSEIKPEHISDEVIEQLEDGGIFIGKDEVLNIICTLTENDFTVIKPGGLYWYQRSEYRWYGHTQKTGHTYSINCRSSNKFDVYGARGVKFTTLEAAKAYCQRMEDEARKEQA